MKTSEGKKIMAKRLTEKKGEGCKEGERKDKTMTEEMKQRRKRKKSKQEGMEEKKKGKERVGNNERINGKV